MNALDFMRTCMARTDDGFAPVARSPLERRQRDAGANLVERNGWLVAAAFPGEAERLARCAIGDLSHLGKLEVRGALGEPPDGCVWYPIAPRRALCVCATGDVDRIASALEHDGLLVLDQTGQMGVIALAGPDARTILRRLCDLDRLPASGLVGHVGAHVLERPGGYWVVFAQEVGHSLWAAFVDAAEPFGGGPVGVDALGELARAT